MPISSKESWRQFQSPNDPAPGKHKAGGSHKENEETASNRPQGGLRIPCGSLLLQIEPRFFVIGLIIFPLYVLAAFVGNDWAYMLPCTLFAALVIGVLLPLLEVGSISCSCRVPPKNATMSEQEIILKAWRHPVFGMLSNLIPSGYLQAQLHLMRRTWSGARKVPAVVPLPVVLESLAQGLEMRLRVPSLGRGQYEAESLEIATCFPFAIAWWSRRISLDSGKEESCITVLPVLKEMAGNFHCRLTAQSISAGRTLKSWMQQHRSSSLKGLREFTERDSLNQIHWASSARTGKLLVREFEVESLPDFDIMLNLEQKWSDYQFDLACSAAYALIHYGHRLGFNPQLRLHPPLDWEPLAEQLADIPQGMAGEELAAEMLARLSPLPQELSQSYKEFEKERKRSAIDINADISSSPRAVISIMPTMPATIEKDSRSIMLVETQKNCDSSLSAGAQVLTSLAQLETEMELCRI